MKNIIIVLISSVALFTISCKDSKTPSELVNHKPLIGQVIINDENIPEDEKIFLRAEHFGQFNTKEELEKWLLQSNRPVVTNGLKELPITNGVSTWRISYNTKDLKGNKTRASGLLVLPLGKDLSQPQALVTVLHATITANIDAPSKSPSEGLWEAGSGLVVGVPDYLGFGDSSQIFHPFLMIKGYQESCADFIKAIYWLGKNKMNINFEKGLYLKGHSEGGYASLALQQYIEKVDIDGSIFNLKGISSSSGPYSIVQAAFAVLNPEKKYSSPVLAPFILLSYRDHYSDLESVLSNINVFQNNNINWNKLYSGQYSLGHIEHILNSQLDNLFATQITNDLFDKICNLDRTDEIVKHMIKNDFLLNNTDIQATKIDTYILACESDSVVPPEVLKIFNNNGMNINNSILTKTIYKNHYPFLQNESTDIHSNCPAIFESTQWIHEKINSNN